MRSLNKATFSTFLIFILAAPVFAQQLDTHSLIQSIHRQIEALQKQIADIEKQLKALETAEQKSARETKTVFNRVLSRGSRGNDVTALQEFLSRSPEIYPEGLVTGYFGPLTEAAVKRFQGKNNISPVGLVGPITLVKINELLTKSVGASGIVPPSLLIAPGIQKLITGVTTDITVAPLERKIFPKPVYDLQGLALLIQDSINKERVSKGYSALVWDSILAGIAADHSADQARDNAELTNPAFPCHLPVIRHEGFNFGFTLKERLANRGVSYRSAGENIAVIPLAENLIYRYPVGSKPPGCPVINNPNIKDLSEEEAKKEYQKIIGEAVAAIKTLSPVEWINIEWLTAEKVVLKVVEGWFDSRGHRENMLSPDFNAGGVGISMVNDYLIITHNITQR